MKIAIDCYGTLLSAEHQPHLLVFIEQALSRGHQITVWSSVSSYLGDAVRILNAAQIKGRERITTSVKVEKEALGEGEDLWDLAIDDQESDYLAARQIIHPKDIKRISF